MEPKKRGRPKNDGQKILTMRLIASIDCSQQGQKSKDERKEQLFLGYEASPPGSYWKRYRLGTRALPYETLEKMHKKAIKLKWIAEPKKSGFISRDLGFLKSNKDLDQVKKDIASSQKRDKEGNRLVNDALTAIQNLAKFLDKNSFWSAHAERYRRFDKEWDDLSKLEVQVESTDLYQFWADINNAEKALSSLTFFNAEVDLQELVPS
jgi:hypothetical protein